MWVPFQITFFCGMKDECEEFESKSALKIAKNNVEKYFAVVGILEKWQESLKLFEHFVPAYFKNVKQIYNGDYKNDRSKINENNIKQETPEYIKKMIAVNFTLELEFYEFCKQRFYKQLLIVK